MLVSSPDKALLFILWDTMRNNGRTPDVTFDELTHRVRGWHAAGVRLYTERTTRAISDAIRGDAHVLESLGLVQVKRDAAALTDTGKLLASTLTLPDWAECQLAGEQGGESPASTS